MLPQPWEPILRNLAVRQIGKCTVITVHFIHSTIIYLHLLSAWPCAKCRVSRGNEVDVLVAPWSLQLTGGRCTWDSHAMDGELQVVKSAGEGKEHVLMRAIGQEGQSIGEEWDS